MPPTLWNTCDYVLQFTFGILHISAALNTAAECLSQLAITPMERIKPEIREYILTFTIQVNLKPTDVAEEEQRSFASKEEIESEDENWLRKEHIK